MILIGSFISFVYFLIQIIYRVIHVNDLLKQLIHNKKLQLVPANESNTQYLTDVVLSNNNILSPIYISGGQLSERSGCISETP